MRKLGSSSLLPLDLEIEKTARRNKKKAKEARNHSSTMADQNDPPDPNAQRRMWKTDALIQSQSASMRALEMQVGHLASAINNRPQGSLPSDTEPNPKNDKREHCKSITLRSGKEIEGDDDVHMMTHHNMDALELSLQGSGDESCEEISECIKELNALPTYRRTFQKFESFEMPEKSKASKPSIEEPPEVELKQLPAYLKYNHVLFTAMTRVSSAKQPAKSTVQPPPVKKKKRTSHIVGSNSQKFPTVKLIGETQQTQYKHHDT
ncbi:hypothetical protein POM88_021502 [Heracleum sosnowskyi]|uniref:Uncharacterized protein n=1 Tax=Heracleum sosnowskyi TaxID=360622 RepID=A0AAD8IDB5_9APIA|nr:hypothetical protein POM88_021502 [Heracleum sosnowskyi]